MRNIVGYVFRHRRDDGSFMYGNRLYMRESTARAARTNSYDNAGVLPYSQWYPEIIPVYE